MKKLISLSSVFFISVSLFAQIETVLPSMRGLYQASFMNPAFLPEHKIQIGLPVLNNVGIDFNLNGINAQGIIDSKDTSGIVDMDKLASNIDGDVFGFRYAYVMDYIYVSFPITHGFYMGVGAQINNQLNFNLSKQLLAADIFSAGNTVSLSGTGAQVMSYSNINLSLAKVINNKFTVGGRFKYLIGHGYAGIEDFAVSTTTGADAPYPIQVNASGKIVTSGIPVLFDEVNGQPTTDEQKKFEPNTLIFPRNSGFAIDLGMTYKFNKKLSMHAALNDVGFIKWRQQAYQYDLNDVQVNYQGLTYDLLNSPSRRQEYFDSLLGLFDRATVSESAFTRWLSARYMAGVDYDITKRDRFGFLLQAQTLPTFTTIAGTVSYTRAFGRAFRFHLNYSYMSDAQSGVGLGLEMKMGPVQLYFVQNNILMWRNLAEANVLAFRLGINVVFGKSQYYKDREAEFSQEAK